MKDAGATSPAGLTRPPALWDTFTIDLVEIRRQLLVHGWSLTDLAQKALVSVTTASRFVRGLSVNPRSAYRIINTLGLRPDELIVARSITDPRLVARSAVDDGVAESRQE